jgi:hypothetical protein
MTSTFGQGDFGVGNFGTATPVNVSGKGASGGGGGRSRWWLSALFHRGGAGAAFAGRTRAIVVAWFVRAERGASRAGRSSWRLFPVYQGQPAPGVFSGQSWPAFAPRAFMSAPVTWRTGGRSLALLHFGGRFLPSPVNPGGRMGPPVIRPQWHRGRRYGAGASGRAHGFVAPIAHARGSARAFGAVRGRLLFTGRFLALPAAFSGRAVLSYSWSNEGAPGRAPGLEWGSAIPGRPDTWTTPGREPAPGWGAGVPGASPDPWSLVPAEAGAWTRSE